MTDHITCSGLKKRIWRMSRNTWESYLNILSLLEYTNPDSDEYEALKEDLRSLPGHPNDLAPNEYIKPMITTVQN